MRLDFHAQVECDLEEAASFYRRRDRRIASRFLDTYDACIRLIRQFPNAAPSGENRLRRSRIGRYPYAVVHAIHAGLIYFVAVENLHRRPGYWHERLKDLPE